MRRRRPDDEELLPIEADDGDAPPEGRIVEIGGGAAGARRRRRPGRDAALLAAVVAVVAGVGLLGDSGTPQEEADAAPTTTQPRRTTTSRPRTTTTSLGDDVVFELGDGPLVPTETGSTVAILLGGGEVSMIDLDSGGRCTVDLGGNDVGWQPTTDGTHAIVHTNQGPFTVDPGCAVGPTEAEVFGEALPGDRPGHVWRQEWTQTEVRLLEVGPDGEPTGREVRTRTDVHDFRAVTGGLVADVHGSITFFDAETGGAREVAKGRLMTARGDRIVTVECTALDCPIRVRDLLGRVVSDVDGGLALNLWSEAVAISPDGRWLGLQAVDPTLGQHAVLVDLGTGARRDLGATNGGPLAFTLDSRYLVGMFNAGLHAVAVEGEGRHLVLRPGRGLQSFVVIARS